MNETSDKKQELKDDKVGRTEQPGAAVPLSNPSPIITTSMTHAETSSKPSFASLVPSESPSTPIDSKTEVPVGGIQVPPTPVVETAKTSLHISDFLNFTSAIFAIVTTAIFYFAGWIYISHWYSFFGIDVTQLNLSTQVILVHGIPGVMIIVLAGLIAASSCAITKFYSKKEAITGDDLPEIVTSAYSLSLFILLGLAYWAFTNGDTLLGFILSIRIFPLEVKISLVGSLALILFLGSTQQSVEIISGKGFTFFKAGNRRFGIFHDINFARTYLWFVLFYERLRRGNLSGAMSVLIGSKDAESELNKREHDFLREVSYKQSKIKNATSRTWQFWVGATIILYFLVSISASSIFGEWDARTGRKSMIGGWRAETTYVYSKKDVPLALPIDKTKTTDDMNVYGPLMVLGKNEDTYYFTDWKYEFHNTEKPNVFVVKIYDAMPFGMQMLAPTSTPTRAQSPTSTHEITITP